MFHGYSGYVQADAHSVYNALFHGDARESPQDKAPDEVRCGSHLRRKFWAAATVSKEPIATNRALATSIPIPRRSASSGATWFTRFARTLSSSKTSARSCSQRFARPRTTERAVASRDEHGPARRNFDIVSTIVRTVTPTLKRRRKAFGADTRAACT